MDFYPIWLHSLSNAPGDFFFRKADRIADIQGQVNPVLVHFDYAGVDGDIAALFIGQFTVQQRTVVGLADCLVVKFCKSALHLFHHQADGVFTQPRHAAVGRLSFSHQSVLHAVLVQIDSLAFAGHHVGRFTAFRGYEIRLRLRHPQD